MNNDTTVVQELTEDGIVSETLMERNGSFGNDVTPEGKEDDSDDENAIIGMETVNMVLNL